MTTDTHAAPPRPADAARAAPRDELSEDDLEQVIGGLARAVIYRPEEPQGLSAPPGRR